MSGLIYYLTKSYGHRLKISKPYTFLSIIHSNYRGIHTSSYHTLSYFIWGYHLAELVDWRAWLLTQALFLIFRSRPFNENCLISLSDPPYSQRCIIDSICSRIQPISRSSTNNHLNHFNCVILSLLSWAHFLTQRGTAFNHLMLELLLLHQALFVW